MEYQSENGNIRLRKRGGGDKLMRDSGIPNSTGLFSWEVVTGGGAIILPGFIVSTISIQMLRSGKSLFTP